MEIYEVSNMNNISIIVYRDMNKCRSNAAAAVVNGTIFISGGSDATDCLTSVECYDASSDVWTIISNTPKYISGHRAVEVDGNLIIMGGYGVVKNNEQRSATRMQWYGIGWAPEPPPKESVKYSQSVWELDTRDKDGEWIIKPFMSIPRYDFSIAKVDDKVFICGGWNKECLDDVQILDGGVWKSGPKMPTTRQYAPAVVVPAEFARSLN